MTLAAVAVFISHSSQDSAIAAQVGDLLRAALNLRAEQIRCTSVDGYRLPAGADSDEQLRDEALNATVFIGILSPFSLASAYVLFELGARWGAKKAILPLLVGGMGPQALRGPLTGLNALTCDTASQLHQLVGEIANSIGTCAEPPAVYQRNIDALLAFAVGAQTRGETPLSSSDSHPSPEGTRNEGQSASAGEYDGTEAIIRMHCERDWPDDYNMRSYCLNQQREAVQRLRDGAPEDIPAEVFTRIRAKCAREWPEDFNMRHYAEQQQIAGYRQVQRGGR